ncbi:MAG TPA: hypothetical protein VGF84_11655 [Micromonosporaceae bacterium]
MSEDSGSRVGVRAPAVATCTRSMLVCRRCGVTVDVSGVVGASTCRVPDRTAGFVVDEAEVTLRGLCPACR